MLESNNKPHIVEEEVDSNSKKKFPWIPVIFFGALIAIAIVCIVLIFQFGGPVSPSASVSK